MNLAGKIHANYSGIKAVKAIEKKHYQEAYNHDQNLVWYDYRSTPYYHVTRCSFCGKNLDVRKVEA